jgi:uncharacterized protein YchJ
MSAQKPKKIIRGRILGYIMRNHYFERVTLLPQGM